MSSSIEAHWQAQAERRRRITRLLLFVILGFLVCLVPLWFWVTQPLFTHSSPTKNDSVDPARLEAHVRVLSEQLVPRDARHPENLDRVAAYIKTEFGRTGAAVSEQPYTIDGKTYRNVIAQFGSDTAERVVIGAHYDAAGALPGADDNASGVAGLIELARLLGGRRLPIRVELVAYTLEEPPYFRTSQMGSAIHAASLRTQGVRVRAMLSLEMIGYFNDALTARRFPHLCFVRSILHKETSSR